MIERSIVNTVISQFLEILIFRVEMSSGASAAEVLGLPQHLRWGIHKFHHNWDKILKSTKRRVESSQIWVFSHFSNQFGIFSL